MKHNVTINTDIELLPNEIARLFCQMSEVEQSLFFNTIGFIVRNEWESHLEIQMQSVTYCKELNEDGRYAMKVFGDYSSKSTNEPLF